MFYQPVVSSTLFFPLHLTLLSTNHSRFSIPNTIYIASVYRNMEALGHVDLQREKNEFLSVFFSDKSNMILYPKFLISQRTARSKSLDWWLPRLFCMTRKMMHLLFFCSWDKFVLQREIRIISYYYSQSHVNLSQLRPFYQIAPIMLLQHVA